MTDDRIENMLSDLIQHVDYDLWKDVFLCEEDDEDSQSLIREWTGVVKKHLK